MSVTSVTEQEWEENLKVREYLKRILIENFFIREDSIFPEAMLDEGLGLDSLEKVRLFNHLEVELDIEFADEEVDETECVQDLIDIIESKQASKELVFAL